VAGSNGAEPSNPGRDLQATGNHPDVVRMNWAGGVLAHCRFPPWEALDGSRAAAAGSVAIGYNGQKNVILKAASGRLLSRDLPRGSIRFNGPEPLHWLRATAPSEVLEVTASPALRRAIAAELGASENCDLGDVHGWEDKLAWAILARFRLGLRGGPPLTDLERDELVRRLYTHVYQLHFGGRASRETSIRRGLDARRMRRVTDHIEANLSEELSIAGLADAAAFSPFHFARCFRRVTGLAPHQFVTARRIERARALLLETGESVEAVAFAVGFTNLRHFRRLFQAQIGVLPFAFRAAHAKIARTDPAPSRAACFPRP
jgi:AraC-like DNA-binding protein